MVGQRRRQTQPIGADRLRCVRPTARWLVPPTHQQHPVLDDVPQQPSIQVTQPAPWLECPHQIDLPIAFPQRTQPFGLPACPRQNHHLAHRQFFRRNGGHQHHPGRQGQAQPVAVDDRRR